MAYSFTIARAKRRRGWREGACCLKSCRAAHTGRAIGHAICVELRKAKNFFFDFALPVHWMRRPYDRFIVGDVEFATTSAGIPKGAGEIRILHCSGTASTAGRHRSLRQVQRPRRPMLRGRGIGPDHCRFRIPFIDTADKGDATRFGARNGRASEQCKAGDCREAREPSCGRAHRTAPEAAVYVRVIKAIPSTGGRAAFNGQAQDRRATAHATFGFSCDFP